MKKTNELRIEKNELRKQIKNLLNDFVNEIGPCEIDITVHNNKVVDDNMNTHVFIDLNLDITI